ncbi:baseplate J/gp47 family protein [Spirosoma pollinicola]|uniref:Uncharacterized protein n=1 Tax=Spirosoma pollinicola TaxID=2057025 RepID=A0A2K8Z4T9_9BACT|nr:baseplate J/gp47 family protein [Spirosoma pollinicola]AUD04885.1 hypothetical protein CWM47_25395 [Spirosoma pollinicola]
MDQDFRPNEFLQTDGINQLQRMLPTLDPAYAKADERTMSDFLKYAYQLAREIRYYNIRNQSEGDWTPFFDEFLRDAATGDMLPQTQLDAHLAGRSDLPPHMALFLIFLKLYENAQQDLNSLTQKHLDYYYRDILGIKAKPAIPDKAHVVFELARNLTTFRLPEGTLLDAGKDSNGKAIRFRTSREISINQAKVAALKTLFVEESPTLGTRIQAAPVANSADGLGKSFAGAASWRPFGATQLNRASSERTMITADIGFALSTPMLLLNEGSRSFTLTMPLSNKGLPATALPNAFRLYLSGAKGWIEPNSITDLSIKIINTQPTLVISASLLATQPAIVAYDDAVLGNGFITPYPVLKLVLNQTFSQFDVLKSLTFSSVTIQVAASGVKNLIVQNDESVVDPAKPFAPFGSQPGLGANCYIGSDEVFTKRLTSLNVNIDWHKLPSDLTSYYEGYFPRFSNQVTPDSFDGVLYFLADGEWQFLAKNTLFNGPENRQVTFSAINDPFRNFGQHRATLDEPLQQFDTSVKNGFIRLELTGPRFDDYDFEAFGHSIFPIVYARKAVALSKAAPTDPAVVLPNPPYTPQIKSLSIDYSAEETFTPKPGDTNNLFWYVEPFGYRQLVPDDPTTLLPVIGGIAFSYIGLSGFVAPATISLLIQTEDGTALAETPDDLLSSRDLTWSYLASDRWVDLDQAAVLAESTEGFQKAGIVMLAIGRDASQQHTLMPAGQHWIRARVASARKADGASNLRSVQTQGVEVEFLATDTNQIITGVAAGTIKKLVTPLTAIRRVSQPFASFGGQGTEDAPAYYTRVAERLRHKNRLVSRWDYEHLVLQAFPVLFKVRCLSHHRPLLAGEAPGATAATQAPGEVQLIVVPNLRNKNYGNPLEPSCSTILRRTIEDFLRPYASAFTTITVSNPVYEQILLDFKVSFRAGKDAGFYAVVLNDEIKRFLSPWAFEEGRDIPFGSKVYKSDLLAFVEGRSYVDFVTDFDMYHLYQGPPRGGVGTMVIGTNFFIKQQIPATINGETGGTIGTDFIIGEPVDSTSLSPDGDAILVSAAQHRITPLSAGELVSDGMDQLSGIGYMVIGLDFDLLV